MEAIESVTPFQECPHCGERLPEHYKYCGYCGEAVIVQPSPSAAPPEATPTADELVEEGFVLSRDRRWPDAIARYHEALKLDPGNQKALRNLGFALNRIRKHDDALTALSRGLELEAERPAHETSLRYERAVALTELKQYDAAMDDIGRVLVLQPRSTKALYLRARIHLYRGNLEGARRDASEVLREIPDHNGALRIVDQVDTRLASA